MWPYGNDHPRHPAAAPSTCWTEVALARNLGTHGVAPGVGPDHMSRHDLHHHLRAALQALTPGAVGGRAYATGHRHRATARKAWPRPARDDTRGAPATRSCRRGAAARTGAAVSGLPLTKQRFAPWPTDRP